MCFQTTEASLVIKSTIISQVDTGKRKKYALKIKIFNTKFRIFNLDTAVDPWDFAVGMIIESRIIRLCLDKTE